MIKFMVMTAGAILAAGLVIHTGAARADNSPKSHVTNIAATARCTGGANTTANRTNCDRPASTDRKAGGENHAAQVQLNPQPLPPSTGNPGERKAGGDPNSKNTGIIIEGHTVPNAQVSGPATK